MGSGTRQHSLWRMSESKEHEKAYDSSAIFEFEIRECTRGEIRRRLRDDIVASHDLGGG